MAEPLLFSLKDAWVNKLQEVGDRTQSFLQGYIKWALELIIQWDLFPVV